MERLGLFPSEYIYSLGRLFFSINEMHHPQSTNTSAFLTLWDPPLTKHQNPSLLKHSALIAVIDYHNAEYQNNFQSGSGTILMMNNLLKT